MAGPGSRFIQLYIYDRAPTDEFSMVVARGPVRPRQAVPGKGTLPGEFRRGVVAFAFREYPVAMILKPQDIFICLKLVTKGRQPWTYQQLSAELFMSASEINAGVRRARRARLAGPGPDGASPQPNLLALGEFLIHGLKYAFPPDRGAVTQGVPTAHGAPPLAGAPGTEGGDPVPVWPHPQGPVRGYAFSPLYRSVPSAALTDPALHELLALVDAIRDERSRVSNLAVRELTARLR
jgi:hypothetical protein